MPFNPSLPPTLKQKKPPALAQDGSASPAEAPQQRPSASLSMAQQPDAQPAPTNTGAQPPVDARGAPTNFTNFSRRFNANKDVATREAGKYAGQAMAAAGKAAGSLASAQTTFANGVNTGSVAPPPGSNAPAGTNTGGAAPVLSGAALEDALNPRPAMSNSAALPAGTPVSPTLPAPTQQGSTSQALTADSTKPSTPSIADMLATAGQAYSGPMGLDTKQAKPDALAAQEQLDALKNPDGVQALVNASPVSGSFGSDALSGALIGSAGQPQFDALRAKFNPNKDLLDAQAAAMKTAADAKKQSAQNASGWGAAAGNAQTAKDAADKAAADKAAKDAAAKEAASNRMPEKRYQDLNQNDTPENRQTYMMSGVDMSDPNAIARRSDEIAKYAQAQQMTTQQQMDQSFADINSVLSPSSAIAQMSGNKDPTQTAAQQQYGFLSLDNPGKGAVNAGASGSTSPMHIPWDKAGVDGFWVWRQMTPDQWQILNSKPSNGPNGQQAWIKNKADELRSKQYSKDHYS